MSGKPIQNAADLAHLPLVSVIMNCFNGEVYLREAIDSVYAQTYANWEIIFWDNASTDGSSEIAKSYDERVRYFRGSENIPLGAARNKAMQQVRGDFIGFLDCDDIWLPDKIERQVKAMSDGVSALCYGGIIKINSNGAEIGKSIPKKKSGHIFGPLLMQFDIELPTAFIRTTALNDSGLEFDCNVTASEEYCLFMELAVNRQFHVIPDVLAKYRIHDGSLTNKSISKWAIEREYTLNKIKRNFLGIEKQYPHGFREAYARANYYKAQYYISIGKRKEAIAELNTVKFVDKKYFCLFVISMFPPALWRFIQKVKLKRDL